MITLIPPAFTGLEWKTIKLGEGAEIEIGLRRPTLSEQLVALQECGPTCEYKVRAHLGDWRGVTDEHGQAVPYSWDALNQLCVSYPLAIWAILDAVQGLHFSSGVDEAKNFESPSLAGGTTTTDATTGTTTSSDSTASSGELSDSATHSP